MPGSVESSLREGAAAVSGRGSASPTYSFLSKALLIPPLEVRGGQEGSRLGEYEKTPVRIIMTGVGFKTCYTLNIDTALLSSWAISLRSLA